MFLERLDAPILGTTYYIPNNDENDMPNCTKFSHDRAQEASENVALKLFKNIGIKGFPMADRWLEFSALPTGPDLKLGSVACCSSEGGSIHVFFIERINPNGTVLISDSRADPDKTLRNERFFRTLDNVQLKTGTIPIGVPGCGKLLGFQYLPITDIRVKRDETKTQLEVFKNRVNCRSSFGTSAPIVHPGCYVPTGIYNVLETKESGGYTWCKVEENRWIAYSPDWAHLYKNGDEPVIIDDLIQDVDRSLNALKLAYMSDEAKLEQILKIIQGK